MDLTDTMLGLRNTTLDLRNTIMDLTDTTPGFRVIMTATVGAMLRPSLYTQAKTKYVAYKQGNRQSQERSLDI